MVMTRLPLGCARSGLPHKAKARRLGRTAPPSSRVLRRPQLLEAGAPASRQPGFRAGGIKTAGAGRPLKRWDAPVGTNRARRPVPLVVRLVLTAQMLVAIALVAWTQGASPVHLMPLLLVSIPVLAWTWFRWRRNTTGVNQSFPRPPGPVSSHADEPKLTSATMGR